MTNPETHLKLTRAELQAEAVMIESLLVAAQALYGGIKVDSFYQAFNVEAQHWAAEMSKAVIQQGAGGAA